MFDKRFLKIEEKTNARLQMEIHKIKMERSVR